MASTGKGLLIKGALRYLWEEVKTMNTNKLSALANILKGYVKMKSAPRKSVPHKARPAPNHHRPEEEYRSW